MTVTNEDLLNIIKTMHADIQARLGMVDTLVRKHEVKLAVIDHVMATVEDLVGKLSTVTKDVNALKVVTKQHSDNWEKVWKYAIGVVLVGVVLAGLRQVLIK